MRGVQSTSALSLPGSRSRLVRILRAVMPCCRNRRQGHWRGGSARSGGCRAARADHDDELLGGVVGVRPADGEDTVVRFVVLVCGCEQLLKAADLWRLWLWRCGSETERERERRRSACHFFGGLAHAQPKELANRKRNLLNLTRNL